MRVSEQDFYNFLLGKEYTIKQGDSFQSEWFLDELGNKIAYAEFSHYEGSIFEINCHLEGNENTLLIITSILNSK